MESTENLSLGSASSLDVIRQFRYEMAMNNVHLAQPQLSFKREFALVSRKQIVTVAPRGKPIKSR